MNVQLPDGSVIQDVPDGTTKAQLMQKLQSNGVQVPKEWMSDSEQKLGWSDVPGKAISNIPSSAGNFVSSLAQAVRHPIDTASNVLDIAAGGLHNVLPDSVNNALEKIDQARGVDPEEMRRSINSANAAGQFFKDRYGSEEGIKNTLAADPIGAASDLSALFTGGAGLANKVPGLAKAASVLRMGAEVTNPINAVTAAASKVAPMVGKGAAAVVGNLATHTGGESIEQAAKAGFAGGETADTFANNLRGNVPKTDVLDTVKQNIEEMGRQKAEAYRSGMAKVSGDKTVLSFDGIDKTLKDVSDAVTFKGQVKNAKAAEVGQKITDEIEKWKSLNPNDFHTPEGLDALKQKVGGIIEGIPFEEKTARMVGDKIYNSIKSEITKQAPAYADTMKGYAEASDQIREIERAFSVGDQASIDTGMRKLQSLMRNNANTNYGNRLDLAKQLEEQGGKEIMPALAGQALNTWTPRGLGNAVAAGLGMGGYALGGPATAIPVLAVQSPRLVGETAFKAGQAAKIFRSGVDSVGASPSTSANLLYQLGRMNQQNSSAPLYRLSDRDELKQGNHP